MRGSANCRSIASSSQMPSISSQPVIIAFEFEPAHGERASAQLVGHGINGVEGFFTLAYINRKPHPVRRLDGVVFVVDEDHLVAGRCVGEADAARGGPVGDFPDGAVRRKLRVRQREKMYELLGFEAADAKGHDVLLCGGQWCAGRVETPDFPTRFLALPRLAFPPLFKPSDSRRPP